MFGLASSALLGYQPPYVLEIFHTAHILRKNKFANFKYVVVRNQLPYCGKRSKKKFRSGMSMRAQLPPIRFHHFKLDHHSRHKS